MVSPQDFVNQIFGVLKGGDNAKLNALLTPAEQQFREQNFTKAVAETPQCKKYFICNSSNSQVLGIVSTSLLSNPDVLKNQTPEVTDYTFKDGQKGKSVVYKTVQATGDAGTTYFVFNLLPSDNNWLLNDYKDLFSDVSAGQKLESNTGLRELAAN